MSVPSSRSIAMPVASASTSRGNSTPPRAATKAAMPDRASVTDYKISLVRADVSSNLALPLYQIAPMESDGMM